MNEKTIGKVVLISVLLAVLIIMGFALWPSISKKLEPGATGPFLLANQQVQLEQQGCAVEEKEDNCPDAYNPDQKDSDRDGKGDVCDDEYNPQKCCGCFKKTQLPSDETEIQEIYGDIGSDETKCQVFAQSVCGPDSTMILTDDLSKCLESSGCEIPEIPATNEFAGTSEISVPLPPQPLTGVTINEVKRDSIKPMAITIILLLLAMLAIVAYIYRKNIGAVFTRKHHKGKKR